MKCYHCGKGILFGRTHTHHRGVAGGRWKKRAPKKQRIFEPNLQPVHILIAGKLKRVKLCTRCLKRVRKDIRDGKKPFVTLAKLQPQQSEKKEVQKEPVKKKTKKVRAKKTTKKAE